MTTEEIFPKEWNPLKLSDLMGSNDISLDRGKVISSIMLNSNPGIYPVYSSSAKNNGLFGLWGDFLVDEELITWSVDGGGYFFYRPKHKFSVTNVCGLMRVNSEKINIKYLYYLLSWQHSLQKYDYVDKAHPSVISKRYVIPQLKRKEQDQIAEILSNLDTAISSTKLLVDKYQCIKRGLLHELLSRGIDEKGNLRSKKTHKFKDSPAGRIPIEWESHSIQKLFNMNLGKMLNKSARIGDNQFVYLANKNVQWGYFDFEDLQKMNFTENEIKKYSLRKGDILMSEVAKLVGVRFGKRKKKTAFIKRQSTGSAAKKTTLSFPSILLNILNDLLKSEN